MKMNVYVCTTVVNMFMHVNIRSFPEHTPKSQHSEPNDHQCDTKLQPAGNGFRNGHPEHKNQDTDNYERGGVSDTPQPSNKRCA
jgi:hypothetical protein